MDENITRRQIDILYQDILAEIGPLLAQVGTLKDQIDKLMRTGQSLPQDLMAVIHESSKRLDSDAAREMRQMLMKLEGLSESTKFNARIAEKATQKIVLLNIVVGGFAGVLGGIFAGMALGKYWFIG